ncbi:hypothetical protein Dimus_032532 [Dionaea muscipula]
MSENHRLQTHLNRIRDLVGSLAMISTITTSGSSTLACLMPDILLIDILCEDEEADVAAVMQSGISSMELRLQQERANSAGPGSQLPEDVVMEILARLPVKSLIRFRCVCKSWFSLIGSVYLATKQLAAGRDDKLDYLLSSFRPRFEGGLEFSLYSLDTVLGSYSKRRFKITLRSPWLRWMCVAVAGPLDGILCFKVPVAMGEVFFLWNPAIGEAKPLPPLTKSVDFFGLGRDNGTGEYKILAISIHRTSSGWSEDIFHETFKAEVYSLGSSSWRTLDVSYFFDGCRRINTPYMNALAITPSMVLSADGRLLSMLGTYTLLGNNGSGNVIPSVFSFDSSDEIFIQTPLPPPSKSMDYYTKGDRLLRHCPHQGATCTLFFLPPLLRRPMEIWMLIGYGPSGSWTKQISLDYYNLHPWSRVDKDWVYYRPSLVSIPKISVKEGEGYCIESDSSISIYEDFPSGRTLFTFQLQGCFGGMQKEGNVM